MDAMTHFNTAVANKAKTIASMATLPRLSHRRSNLFGVALGAKCSMWFVLRIPKWSTKFVIVALESQFLSKLSVFIFECRGRLFKIVQGVQYRLDLLLSLTILHPFLNFVQLFRDFCRRLYECQSTRNGCDWFHEADFTPSDLII
jgi:hypothetical protein